MNQPTMWKFTCIDQTDNRTTEVTVMLPDDASWDEVLTNFAHFLEGTGYVGVVSALDSYGSFDRFKGCDVE